MALTTADLAAYLRTATDSGLQPYLDAARSKARAAGIPDYEHNAQYDLFILALAAMYYDNRGMGTPLADPVNAQNMINAFVLELRHAGEDPQPGDPVHAVGEPE